MMNTLTVYVPLQEHVCARVQVTLVNEALPTPLECDYEIRPSVSQLVEIFTAASQGNWQAKPPFDETPVRPHAPHSFVHHSACNCASCRPVNAELSEALASVSARLREAQEAAAERIVDLRRQLDEATFPYLPKPVQPLPPPSNWLRPPSPCTRPPMTLVVILSLIALIAAALVVLQLNPPSFP